MYYKVLFVLCSWLLLLATSTSAQLRTLSSSEIYDKIQRLPILGSVLYFAAHPDDENTLLLSWLANEKKYRTAYLSLTRGDGGQNLIGTEQSVELGLIRTQEMLAARGIDGAEQFFGAAYDFGFSKTYEETFAFWDKEETLREAVYIIRKFRPDVIINRFPPDKRGGHGHHQASAMLSHEAFIAAADPTRFPEQLNELDVWQAKRLLWNTANFGGQNNTSTDQLQINVGQYSPLLGIAYGEMAAISRSQHKSQGFGSSARRGEIVEYFEHVAGDQATTSLMDGIVTDWNRVAESAKIPAVIDTLLSTFDVNAPQKSIPTLIELYGLIQKVPDPYWCAQKSKEVEELIVACAGLFISTYTDTGEIAVGEQAEVKQEIVVQNPDVDIQILRIDDQEIDTSLPFNTILRHRYSVSFDKTTQPYWLERPRGPGKFDVREQDFGEPVNRDAYHTPFNINIHGQTIQLDLPIRHRIVDPVRGELYDDIRVVPSLSGRTDRQFAFVKEGEEQVFSLSFSSATNDLTQEVSVISPTGVDVFPRQIKLDFSESKTISQQFTIRAADTIAHDVSIEFQTSGEAIRQKRVIQHNHIPTLAWFPPLTIRLIPMEYEGHIKRIAYVQGAGDRIPESLREIGIQVDILQPSALTSSTLASYDALVFGVRAFNVHRHLGESLPEINRYVEGGGVVVTQYNVNSGLYTDSLGPFPFHLTRARVTEEDSRVTILLPADPVMQFPNQITEKDFEGWVQERGLYFAEDVDERYRRPLAMHDKGESPHDGSLLIAPYGSGQFVYTSLSFFRQLPAGVPGAYRLFLNLLHKEQ